MRQGILVLLAVLLTCPSERASGQSSSPISIQGSILIQTLGDEDVDVYSAGAGLEGLIRFSKGALSVGVGGQYTIHEGEMALDLTMYGPFIEPRLVFPLDSDQFAPYASVRLGHTTGTAEALLGSDVEYSFTYFNVGGGILVNLTRRINMDFGGTIGRIVDGGSGFDMTTRAGISIGF